jgi:hypothetical protein
MIDPRGMTMHQWFDAVVLDTKSNWTFGRLDGDDWRAYATQFLHAFIPRVLPDPYQFDGWRDWAMRAAVMLENR